MQSETWIEVTVPETGASVRWKAINRQSAIRQAKLEAARGGLVCVREKDIVVWTNIDDKKLQKKGMQHVATD